MRRNRNMPRAGVAAALALAVALGTAVWLRAVFFRAFPDPLPTADTWSYLTGTYSLLLDGRFDLFSMRTPALSLFVWGLLVLFGKFAAVTLAQSALTILNCLFIVYVVRAFGGPWRIGGVVGAALLALNAHLRLWEHFLMTEASFSAALEFTLGETAIALRRPTPAAASIAGVLAGVCVLIRPLGMFLPPIIVAARLCATRRLGRRTLLAIGAAAIAGPVILLAGLCARNVWVGTFDTVEDLRQTLLEFKARYNRAWLCERHEHQRPAQVRARLLERAA